MKRSATLALVVGFLIYCLGYFVSWVYEDHGPGDQLGTLSIILISFAIPLLSPFLLVKDLLFGFVLSHDVEEYIVKNIGGYLLTPTANFTHKPGGEIPDYTKYESWVCFGGEHDDHACDIHPGDALKCEDLEDKSLCNAADVFYLAPTTFYSSASWNAPLQHPIVHYLLKEAITPQQASAFNIVGKIYSPFIRQASAAVFLLEDFENHPTFKAAISVAYSDAKAAFEHFLHHRRQSGSNRGIILAGHSQGSVLLEMLVDEYFVDKPLADDLIAAYLVGWSISKNKFPYQQQSNLIHTCQVVDDTNCVVSWRTIGFGGDPSKFLFLKSLSKESNSSKEAVCVNPLSWSTNESYIALEHNLGGLDLLHPWTMWNYLNIGNKRILPADRVWLPTKTHSLSDAQCINGDLYATMPSLFGYGWGVFPIWRFATFPGKNLHTYDYNLFFHNIRQNAVDRTRAFLQKK